jgi:hypothetical protein
MVAAFKAARSALEAAALLAHPQQDQELALMVDASADHVSAALQITADIRHIPGTENMFRMPCPKGPLLPLRRQWPQVLLAWTMPG